MAKRKSGKAKIAEGWGTGRGSGYKPYFLANRQRGHGVRTTLVDWKHRRTVHTMSRVEADIYYLIRWDDRVLDINEQYPLLRSETDRIELELGVNPLVPGDKDNMLTITFLVHYWKADGENLQAISVKSSREEIFGDPTNDEVARNIRRAMVEKKYWNEKGINFRFLFGDEVDRKKARCIKYLVAFYNLSQVTNLREFTVFLAAHKLVDIDFSNFTESINNLPERCLQNLQSWEAWIQKVFDKVMLSPEDLQQLEKIVVHGDFGVGQVQKRILRLIRSAT